MQWGNVKEAATACGLPPESWRTWERDGVAPRRIVEIAEQIAKKTGCDYLWLLTGRRIEQSVSNAAGTTGQTTGPNVEEPKRPQLTGQPKPATPPKSSRRPARITPAIAELMPDTPMELLALAGGR